MTLALLRNKMVQIEKEMRDLASKNATSQPHISEDSQSTEAPSKHKKDKTPNQNKEGSRENEDDQDAEFQKVPLYEEIKEGEKKLKDHIVKLEQ
jgi:hypothetical protein